jgi:phosphoglucomutase/phosphoglucomutase/phosphopentomutase
VSEHYYGALANVNFRQPDLNARAPPMVYTALHGVGTPYIQQAFAQFGLPAPLLVEQQCAADPDFTTVAFPNPEEGEGAWQLAFQRAAAAGAVLAFATDPDAGSCRHSIEGTCSL